MISRFNFSRIRSIVGRQFGSCAPHARYTSPNPIVNKLKLPINENLHAYRSHYFRNASWYWGHRAWIAETYGLGNCCIVEKEMVAGVGPSFDAAAKIASENGFPLTDHCVMYIGMEDYSESLEFVMSNNQTPQDILLVAQQIAVPHEKEWMPHEPGMFKGEYYYTIYADCPRAFCTVPIKLAGVRPEYRDKEFPVTFLADTGAPRCSLAHRYFQASGRKDGITGWIYGRSTGFVDPKSQGYYLPHENINVLSLQHQHSAGEIKEGFYHVDVDDESIYRQTFSVDPDLFHEKLESEERRLFDQAMERFLKLYP